MLNKSTSQNQDGHRYNHAIFHRDVNSITIIFLQPYTYFLHYYSTFFNISAVS